MFTIEHQYQGRTFCFTGDRYATIEAARSALLANVASYGKQGARVLTQDAESVLLQDGPVFKRLLTIVSL